MSAARFIRTRQFPEDVQGLFIFACVSNMHGFTTFTLGDDGSGYQGARRKKPGVDHDGKAASVPDDLLDATDANFRPADPQIGPDGALYFADWHNALVGHVQYSQRDPSRDHRHGRIYRLIYKGKPLLAPVTQAEQSVPALLDQLRAYELRTRYRARRELRERPVEEVTAAVREWVAKLDPHDPEYDRLLCEACGPCKGITRSIPRCSPGPFALRPAMPAPPPRVFSPMSGIGSRMPWS